MLSFRVNAFPHVGQLTFFSPVCFFPWRAAWPEVVKVSMHLYSLACGQGYFFLGREEELAVVGVVPDGVELRGLLAGVGVVVMEVFTVFMGGVGSVFMGWATAEVGGGAEVGSILDFVRRSGGWFDCRGEIGGRPWCVVGGPRGFHGVSCGELGKRRSLRLQAGLRWVCMADTAVHGWQSLLSIHAGVVDMLVGVLHWRIGVPLLSTVLLSIPVRVVWEATLLVLVEIIMVQGVKIVIRCHWRWSLEGVDGGARIKSHQRWRGRGMSWRA